MPEDLRLQINLLPELARHFAIPCLCLPTVEADDTIGSLAWQASQEGWNVRMITCDKDLDQLLSSSISTWDPLRRRLRGPQELWQERAILPEQVIDWLCMVGDTADNIPGIRGIGSIGASRLLSQYGSLDAILQYQSDFSAKRQQALEAFRERAEMMRTLVHIRRDVKLPCTLQDLALPQQWDLVAMQEWLRSIGLPSARFTATRRQRASDQKPLVEWLEGAHSPLAIYPWESGLRLEDAHGNYRLLLPHDYQQALPLLHTWRTDPQRRILCSDIRLLDHHFPAALHSIFNDCHQSWCASVGDTSTQLTYEGMAVRHHRLQLSHPVLADRYDRHYRPLFLHLTKQSSWAIERTHLHHISEQLQLLHGQILHELQSLAGDRLWHPQRPQALRHLLFDRCGITPPYHDQHGPRIDTRALQAMQHQHEAVRLVLQERQLRLRNKDLRQLLNAEQPHLHSSHYLDRTTGTLRCQLHTMGTIPEPDSIDTSIAQLLCAPPQEHIISLHLEYAELAALAADIQDQTLIDLLASPHPWQQIASLIMQRPCETIGPQESRIAQCLFLGHLHAVRSNALARRCQLEDTQTQLWLNNIQEMFPQCSAWRQAVLNGSLPIAWPSPSPLPTTSQRLQTVLASRVAIAITRCAADSLRHDQLPQLRMVHGSHLLFVGSLQQQQQLTAFVHSSMADALPGARIHCGHGSTWLDANRQSNVSFISTPAIRMTA